MDLEPLVRDQNPWWIDSKYFPRERSWYHRPFYQEIVESLGRNLIVSLTGLRRVGKSTLIKQVIGDLLSKYASQHVFYFSFDGSVVKNESETLRKILNIYSTNTLKKPLAHISGNIFVFFDEIQIIPNWQDVIKTYYDLNPHLKFIISGSSALFISRKSTESLAGRLKEILIPPLSFLDYLNLNKETNKIISDVGLKKYSSFFPEYLNVFFEMYLEVGQFPQPVRENFTKKETQEYLKTVEDKIIDIDLPRTFPVKRSDILKIIFNYFKQSSGALLSYENLTNDLGVDIRTTIKYIDWLRRAFLVDSCLNVTKKVVKASRTAKKFYLTSPNFAQNLSMGQKVETYIFNFLKNLGLNTEFFRIKNKEIDFILTTGTGKKIPLEVKYQENVEKSDEENLINFILQNRSPYAFLITKNKQNVAKKVGKTLLYYIPAAKIETINQNAFLQKFS